MNSQAISPADAKVMLEVLVRMIVGIVFFIIPLVYLAGRPSNPKKARMRRGPKRGPLRKPLSLFERTVRLSYTSSLSLDTVLKTLRSLAREIAAKGGDVSFEEATARSLILISNPELKLFLSRDPIAESGGKQQTKKYTDPNHGKRIIRILDSLEHNFHDIDISAQPNGSQTKGV